MIHDLTPLPALAWNETLWLLLHLTHHTAAFQYTCVQRVFFAVLAFSTSALWLVSAQCGPKIGQCPKDLKQVSVHSMVYLSCSLVVY